MIVPSKSPIKTNRDQTRDIQIGFDPALPNSDCSVIVKIRPDLKTSNLVFKSTPHPPGTTQLFQQFHPPSTEALIIESKDALAPLPFKALSESRDALAPQSTPISTLPAEVGALCSKEGGA